MRTDKWPLASGQGGVSTGSSFLPAQGGEVSHRCDQDDRGADHHHAHGGFDETTLRTRLARQKIRPRRIRRGALSAVPGCPSPEVLRRLSASCDLLRRGGPWSLGELFQSGFDTHRPRSSVPGSHVQGL